MTTAQVTAGYETTVRYLDDHALPVSVPSNIVTNVMRTLLGQYRNHKSGLSTPSHQLKQVMQLFHIFVDTVIDTIYGTIEYIDTF